MSLHGLIGPAQNQKNRRVWSSITDLTDDNPRLLHALPQNTAVGFIGAPILSLLVPVYRVIEWGGRCTINAFSLFLFCKHTVHVINHWSRAGHNRFHSQYYTALFMRDSKC